MKKIAGLLLVMLLLVCFIDTGSCSSSRRRRSSSSRRRSTFGKKDADVEVLKSTLEKFTRAETLLDTLDDLEEDTARKEDNQLMDTLEDLVLEEEEQLLEDALEKRQDE